MQLIKIYKVFKEIIFILLNIIPCKRFRKYIKIKKIENKLSFKYNGYVFFITPNAGIGEFVQSISLLNYLSKKINKKILIVTNKKNEVDICNLYNLEAFYDANLDVSIIIRLSLFNINKYKVNNLYPMYFIAGKNCIPRSFDIDFQKDYLGISQNVMAQHIIPEIPKSYTKAFEELLQFIKTNKTIFIFPDANTYDSQVVKESVWINLADELAKSGYACIFNSSKSYGKYKKSFLSITETIYLASIVNGIITFRSGLSELLALTCKNDMAVIYPNGTTDLFKKSLNIDIAKFEKRILENTNIILNKDLSIIENTYRCGSLDKNFNRDNIYNYIYDYDNVNFFTNVKNFLERKTNV